MQLAEAALGGSVAQRKGIAQVGAANVSNEEVRDRCEAWLLALFADEEKEVRDEAGDWARQIEPDDLGGLAGLAEAFMDSPAYLDDPTMLLVRLEETTAEVPKLMLQAALRFAEGAGRDAADIRRSAAADAPHASNLAIRAYSSTVDPDLRSRALDAIDLLLASGVRDMEERISQLRRLASEFPPRRWSDVLAPWSDSAPRPAPAASACFAGRQHCHPTNDTQVIYVDLIGSREGVDRAEAKFFDEGDYCGCGVVAA